MTITVAKLKRAFVELRDNPEHGDCQHFAALARNPTALSMLAEMLSERPAPLAMDHRTGVVTLNYIARKDCPTQLGDACKQGEQCCQRNPEWIGAGVPDDRSGTLD